MEKHRFVSLSNQFNAKQKVALRSQYSQTEVFLIANGSQNICHYICLFDCQWAFKRRASQFEAFVFRPLSTLQKNWLSTCRTTLMCVAEALIGAVSRTR